MRTAFPLSGHIGGVSVSKRQNVVWRSARAALVATSLLCGSAVFAQTASSSVLTGNVVDAATKAPVADVVVTATSPGLQGEQVVVTDASGLYRVPQLPPGTYTLRFEKESYRPFSRTGIDVASDRTLRLNVELLPETAGATEISVVGSPPTVDVGSSTTGTTVSQDFVRNLAVSRPGGLGGANRSFDSLAVVAPQANADVFGVGINGTTSPENSYLIDGLSVNNPAYGTLSTPLTSEFIDEVNVITGGYMPEYGRTTGGAISAVTKSGGNEFHGSLSGTFSPGSWTGAPGVIPGASGTINGKRENGNIGDFGATVGGYIIKDKLWFFAGIQYAAQRYIYYRSFSSRATPTDPFLPIDNATQRRFGDEHGWNYIGKLTYLISSDHRLSVSVTGTPTYGGGGGSFPLRTQGTQRAPQAAGLYTLGTFNSANLQTKFDSLNILGELNSSFMDKKLLLDVTAGWSHVIDSALPGDGSWDNTVATEDNLAVLSGVPSTRGPSGSGTNILLLENQVPANVVTACSGGANLATNGKCPAIRYFYGGGGFLENNTLDSIQAKAILTYLLTGLGHHVLKGGVDANWGTYNANTSYSGGTAYRTTAGRDPNDPAYQVFDIRRYGAQTDVDVVNQNTIVNKKVNSTIVGFFVQDSWSIMDKVTLNLGLRYDSLAMKNTDGVTGLALNDQWSPRIGLVWDPTQQGRSKIFANYGKYYEYIPLDLANRSLSAETQIRANHQCNPNSGRLNCDANTVVGLGTAPSTFWSNTGTPVPSAVDPNIKSPSDDEIVAGAEYEIIPNARLGVTYTYRNITQWIEDMSNNDGASYFIGNPGQGIASTFPKAQRTYNAVTVQFTKNFADLWLAQASYTWAKLEGNLDGLFRPQDNQLDPNINSTFDLRALLLNQYGPLSGDITHSLKLFLAKEFVITPVFSFSLGGSFNANSGTPINALGAQAVYGDRQAFIVNQGSAGRLPWVTSLDLKVNLSWRLGKDSVVTGGLEIFNVFNSQRPTTVDDRYTTGVVGPIIGANNGQIPTTTPPGYGAVVDNAGVITTPANGSLPLPRLDSAGAPIQVLLPNPDQRSAVAVPINLTWGRPASYQAVRQFRFSVRVTF